MVIPLNVKYSTNIDISDHASLEAAKSNLVRLLSIVEFALSKSIVAPVVTNGRPDIRHFINGLPDNFSMTDVILSLGDEGKENRARAKMVLMQLIKLNQLKVVRLGKGRRPTEYQKINGS